MQIRHVLIVTTLSVALVLSSPAVSAQTPSTAERLIREEQVREAVEDAFDLYAQQTPYGDVRNDNLVRAVDRLVEIGPEAVPYLVGELEQALHTTFFFVTYALGRIGTDEAERALREAIATADKQPGDWPALRKAWCCWALGLMGIAEAIDLAYVGRHKAGHVPIHGDFTVVESIAVQTAPESVPLLEKQLTALNSDNDPRYAERVILLKAFGEVAEARTRKTLIRVLAEEHPLMARQAAYSLGRHDDPEAVTALLEALDTPDIRVRRAVALALYDALPVGRLEAPVAKLESEDNPIVRGALYRVIGRAGGPPYTDVLIAQWGREDAMDRRQLVQVLPQLDHAKALPILEKALRDPESQVAVAAAIALRDMRSPGAIRMLIETVSSPSWTLAATCVDQLVRLEEALALPAIATRLLEVELAGVVKDPRRRMRAEKLSDALVALGGTDHLEALRLAAARQKDGQLVQSLDRQVKRLETQKDNGKKTKRWLEALESSDPDVRLEAYEFFKRNGNARTARTLVDMFGRVEPEEGLAILRAVGQVDCEATTELIERVLTAPEFDSFERASLRDTAAWSARRIGGERMRGLLEAAVDRREGRDTRPLVYYALVAKADSIPLLERYRALRMHYITWKRGEEMKKLDWIQRELAHGRPLDPVDLPPQDLSF